MKKIEEHQSETTRPTAEQSEYDTFKAGLRHIMSVPKAEIDRHESEYQKHREQEKKTKKAG